MCSNIATASVHVSDTCVHVNLVRPCVRMAHTHQIVALVVSSYFRINDPVDVHNCDKVTTYYTTNDNYHSVIKFLNG